LLNHKPCLPAWANSFQGLKAGRHFFAKSFRSVATPSHERAQSLLS
jgi:hypothetical protein